MTETGAALMVGAPEVRDGTGVPARIIGLIRRYRQRGAHRSERSATWRNEGGRGKSFPPRFFAFFAKFPAGWTGTKALP